MRAVKGNLGGFVMRVISWSQSGPFGTLVDLVGRQNSKDFDIGREDNHLFLGLALPQRNLH
jgi:hypothetical protein